MPPETPLETSIDRCLSVRQAAKYFGCSPSKILAWIKAGKLQALNISASPRRPQYRITPDAVRDFIGQRAAVMAKAPHQKRERRPPGWIDRY